jgi:hypothetical protein
MFARKPRLEEQLTSINLMIRILKRQSEKSKKQQKNYYEKARRATWAGDMKRAEIYAQQCIKHETMSLRYLRLSMRMEIVEAMAKSALDTGMITQGVAGVINTVTKTADPTAVISGITHFERMFDEMSIAEGTVGMTMDSTGGLMSPGESREAREMLAMFTEEAAMGQSGGLPSASTGPVAPRQYISNTEGGQSEWK